jgi:hypothetical protein
MRPAPGVLRRSRSGRLADSTAASTAGCAAAGVATRTGRRTRTANRNLGTDRKPEVIRNFTRLATDDIDDWLR